MGKFISFVVICFTLGAAAVAGYIGNIIEIANIINDPISGMLLLRLVGIVVAPLGAILGWL